MFHVVKITDKMTDKTFTGYLNHLNNGKTNNKILSLVECL